MLLYASNLIKRKK